MHPRELARRRAVAEARLTQSMETLAKRQGVRIPDRPTHRDAGVRDLMRLEQVAEVLAQVAGREPEKAMATDLEPRPSRRKAREGS